MANIVINTWTDLANIASDFTASYILGRSLLTTDSDYAGLGDSWTPLGNGNTATGLTGTLDGNRYFIDGLTVNTAGNYAGLFQYAKTTSLIQNLALTNVNITCTGNNCGAFVGQDAGGTLKNCYSTGTITNNNTLSRTGGLCGVFSGTMTVQNCYSTAALNNNKPNTTALRVGGVCGTHGGTGVAITNCFYAGTITANEGGSAFVGGFIGNKAAGGSVTNCGWWTGSGPTNAYGNSATALTYPQANVSDFYDKTLDLYDTQAPTWDFSTIWLDHAAALPSFLSNLKTVSSLAYASVKNRDNLAVASLQSLDGLYV